MKRTSILLAILLLSLLNFTGCGETGPYRVEIGKLHSGMSRNDVIAALGKPYGDSGDKIIYYQGGANTMLAVQFDDHGNSGWLLLETPATGPSETFSYYKVVKQNNEATSRPAALGMTVFRTP